MTYQDLINEVGGFGPYQKKLCVFLFISTFTCAIGTLTMIFTTYDPGYRCTVPEYDDVTHPNYSNETKLSSYLPWNSDKNETHKCKKRVVDDNGVIMNETTTCVDGITFNSYEYNTVVTEFQLVCDDDWKGAFTISLFMMGEAIGSLTGGALSDRFGRKKVFLISKLAEFAIYFTIGLTKTFSSYVLLRWLEGVFVYLPYTTAFVLGNELMKTERRNILSLFIYGGYCTGSAFIAVLGYFITDWHWMMKIVGLSGVIYIPYYWLIPESPFWLLQTGRIEEAKELLTKIARSNGKKNFNADEAIKLYQKDEKDDENVNQNDNQRYTTLLKEMMQNSTILVRLLVAYLSWIVTNMVYYGLALSVTDLNGNRFINTFISGLLEFPGIITGYLLLQYVGRAISLSATMGVGGICLAMAPFFGGMYGPMVMTSLVIAGKTVLISSFYVNFSITGEMAPTLFRNLAVGSCSAFGKIGSFTAPYLMYLGRTNDKRIPYVIMGCIALVSALLSFIFLPETKGTVLPATVEDAVQLKPYIAHRKQLKRKNRQKEFAEIQEELKNLKA